MPETISDSSHASKLSFGKKIAFAFALFGFLCLIVVVAFGTTKCEVGFLKNHAGDCVQPCQQPFRRRNVDGNCTLNCEFNDFDYRKRYPDVAQHYGVGESENHWDDFGKAEWRNPCSDDWDPYSIPA